jgi:N-acetylmuramoyl-L-alanine amidase
MEIRQQLVADRSKTFGEGNTQVGIAIHETANQGKGAGAQAHANLQTQGGARSATWHWQVDDTTAVQSFDNGVRCWHAGDGRGAGNMSHVAIEICINPDSDYLQAVRNAAELVRYLRGEGVGSGLKQHNAFSGKNCPTWLRAGGHGINWDGFVALVNGGTVTPVSNPIQVPQQRVVSEGVPAPAFPLPDGHCFGPKSGPVYMHSGFYNHRDDLRTWQQRMADRGWVIEADGLYGPHTALVASAFQSEKGLTVDSLIGKDTWAAAWTAPITR